MIVRWGYVTEDERSQVGLSISKILSIQLKMRKSRKIKRHVLNFKLVKLKIRLT